jgi:hypothetical protein
MKKLLWIIAIAAVAAIAYFWQSSPEELQVNNVKALAPEDQAIVKELNEITTADLEAEFKEIDAALQEL